MAKNKDIVKICKFFVSGGSSTLIDFIVYIGLSTKLSINISKCISMIIASIYGYFLNKKWVFQNIGKINKQEIIKYYIVFLINFALNVSVNYFVYQLTKQKILSFIVATGCATVINFILQKMWVFKN